MRSPGPSGRGGHVHPGISEANTIVSERRSIAVNSVPFFIASRPSSSSLRRSKTSASGDADGTKPALCLEEYEFHLRKTKKRKPCKASFLWLDCLGVYADAVPFRPASFASSRSMSRRAFQNPWISSSLHRKYGMRRTGTASRSSRTAFSTNFPLTPTSDGVVMFLAAILIFSIA